MADIDPICLRLRQIREEQGWTLAQVEERSHGMWRAAVVASYERGDRTPPVTKVRGVLEFYGFTLAAMGPDEVVASTKAGGEMTTQWVVVLPGWELPVATRTKAIEIAAGNPDARAGYRTVTTSPVVLLDEVTR